MSIIVCVQMKQINRKRPDFGWRICCVVAFGLMALAFSPLILATGQSGPELFGIPRTLWSGIAISIAFVLLTLIGSKVHPDRESNKADEPRAKGS